MSVTLGPVPDHCLSSSSYGKAGIHLVRLTHNKERYELTDLTVSTTLAGDFDATHLSGDNSAVLPTDTQKNVVFAFAQRYGVTPMEEYAQRLARHFVETTPAATRARVSISAKGWERFEDQEHTFVGVGPHREVTQVVFDGERTTVVSGLTNMPLLNTTGSEFVGFLNEEYTTLPEARDRILATTLNARWRYAEPAGTTSGYPELRAAIRRQLITAFADTYSRSLQETLYAMGNQVLAKVDEVAEIRLSLPNQHHNLVNLEVFGQSNDREVWWVQDRPYGLIEGTLTRPGAPDAGWAWW